jgi:8-oxo-dGTP pyrophosphatase MutT (NUDIX family)
MAAALQSAVDPDELAALESEWGPAPHWRLRLEVDDPFLTVEPQRLVKDGRRAEICYIMHRGDPADGLLLHIKTIYPKGAFRLPTGGVQPGESVLATLVREIYEETGLTAGKEVEIERFLGLASYAMPHRSAAATYSFATYHFLVRMAASARLEPQDLGELICDWQWRPTAELGGVATFLEGIGATAPGWADWGRFRALSHRFVEAALATTSG